MEFVIWKGGVPFLCQDFHSAVRLLTSVELNCGLEKKPMILVFQLQCLHLL